MVAQPFLGIGRLARGLQRGLRRKKVVMDAKLGQIGADHVHHRADCLGTEQAEPRAFRRRDEAVAIFGRELAGDRDQIVAGIQPLGDRADVFAERLAIPHMHRACEDIDLTPRIVDVIFADHVMARIFEQRRERVANDGAAAMADMHRAGRVGRHIFDVDPPPLPHRRAAIIARFVVDQRQFVPPAVVDKPQVDEARASDARLGHFIERGEFGNKQVGERARVHAGGLGQHHRGVGRDVAMRGIARRLDADRAAIEPGGQGVAGGQRIERGTDMVGKTGEQGHGLGLSSIGKSLARALS